MRFLCAISCLNVSQPVGAEEIHPTAGETDFIGAFAISGSDVGYWKLAKRLTRIFLTASHARITNSIGVEVPPIIKSANVQDTPGIYQATIGTTIMSSVEKDHSHCRR